MGGLELLRSAREGFMFRVWGGGGGRYLQNLRKPWGSLRELWGASGYLGLHAPLNPLP